MAAAVKTHQKTNATEYLEPIVLPDYDAIIAERAYYKAESRNFEPGHEIDDWLEAEQEYTQGGK